MQKQNDELSQLLDRVYAKCIPDQESGCMVWTGAVQPCGGSPAIKSNGKGTSLRRLILTVANGRKVDHRMRATHSCGNSQCVRLEHIRLMSRKELQQRSDSKFNAAQRLMKSLRCSEKARARAKLTMELAMEIRLSDSSQRTLARQYGISQATVNAIKNGRTWQDHANPFMRLAA